MGIEAFKNTGKNLAKVGAETVVSELIKSSIERHLLPFIERTSLLYGKEDRIRECLEEYLDIIYEKANIMNTIVFRGVVKNINDLYIPLTLVKPDHEEGFRIDGEGYISLLNRDKVLVVDTAGMGKTTIVKYLIVQCINRNNRIPILIELRKLERDMKITEYIFSQFQLLGKSIDKDDIISMLRTGEFIVFFDGFDEVDNEYKGKVLDNIQEFILKAGDNRYIVTSREEAALSSMGAFEKFSIKPLHMEEAFSLIKKYDQNGELSEKLIDRIKKDKQLNILKEFLTNPLLVSLLYKTFQYKEEIAYKKLDFYSQVYEALFNDHDKTKGGAYVHEKVSMLDSTDFERLLRRIAFISLRQNKVEYIREDFLAIIQEAIDNMSWIKAQPDKVKYDITHAIPFFQKDGVYYKWTHKSFMEYFAAGFICYESGKIGDLLKQMIDSSNSSSYINVLDFCIDMKPEVFREIVIHPFLSRYIQHCKVVYESDVYDKFDSKELERRKYVSFLGPSIIFLYEDRKTASKEMSTVYSNKKVWKDLSFERIHNTCHVSADRFFVALPYSKEAVICNILNMKNIDVFESETVSSSIKCVNIPDSLSEGIYVVDDNEECWYNSENTFEQITKRIHHTFDSGYDSGQKILDLQKCIQLKEDIEKEMAMKQMFAMDLA